MEYWNQNSCPCLQVPKNGLKGAGSNKTLRCEWENIPK